MKALLLLAIFCAVSYASISPQWTAFNDKSYYTTNFNWTEVTVQSAPVKGEWLTINFCGVANTTYLNNSYVTYTVGTQQQKAIKAGSVNFLGDRTTWAGVQDCEFFSFKVPQFNGSSFFVKLDLYALDYVGNNNSHYQSSVKIDFNI